MKKALERMLLMILAFLIALPGAVWAAPEQAASEVRVIEIKERTQSTLPEIPVETEEERKRIDAELVSHVYTGREITKVPDELREPDPRGGTVLRMPGVDFGTDLIKDWSSHFDRADVAEMKFVDQGDGKGYHEYICKGDRSTHGFHFTDMSKNGIPIKPNRKYIVSMLLWLDYTRLGEREPTEITACFRMYDDANKEVLNIRHGLTDYTDGWKRIEFEASSGLMEAAKYATPQFVIYNMKPNGNKGKIGIADIAVIEMPEEEPRPAYAEGDGVTFRGNAGNIDMRVVSATESNEEIVVETTGVIYKFDKVNDIITASQKIGLKRDVSVWEVGTDLSTLSVKSAMNTECVVSNPEITFGVQMDGILFLTPTKGDVSMKCTSQISGLYNRYAFGHLTVVDGYGGFTVTPDISMGSGLVSDCTVLTENLDFAEYTFRNRLRLNPDDNKPYEINTLISNCKPGFQLLWKVRPGERLAISTFPPKEYDWYKSFHSHSKMNTYSYYTDIYKDTWVPELKVDSLSLWKFSDHNYAHEYNQRYTHAKWDEALFKNVRDAQAAGMEVIYYISAYFFQDSTSPDPYIKEVKRIRDTYGIDGVYSDGTPSEWRWITAYEDVRLLRELFPDGFIRIHNTGCFENGGPPLSSPSFFIPGLEAYISSVYKGETVAVSGLNPGLVSLTSCGYNVSNSLGDYKGDAWYIEKEDGTMEKLPHDDFVMLGLEWNMRRVPSDQEVLKSRYLPMMAELEALWNEKGDEPEFYEKYFQPKARELVKDISAKYGYYKEVSETFEDMPSIKEFGFYNVKSEIVDTDSENKALKLEGALGGDSEIIKRFAPVGGPLSVSYRLKVSERGDFEQQLSSMNGATPITLKFTSDGRICIKNTAGYYVRIGRYKTDEWMDIRIEIDTDKKHYGVFVNDKELLHHVKSADNLYNVSELKLNIGKSCGECFLDDLVVLNKY